MMFNSTGTSGRIVVVTSRSQLISSPELILNLDSGTSIPLHLSKCNNSILLSEILTFPPAIITYILVGYDETGALFEYTVEESVVLGNPDMCHEYAYATCLAGEEDPVCICEAGYTGNGSYCTGNIIYLKFTIMVSNRFLCTCQCVPHYPPPGLPEVFDIFLIKYFYLGAEFLIKCPYFRDSTVNISTDQWLSDHSQT